MLIAAAALIIQSVSAIQRQEEGKRFTTLGTPREGGLQGMAPIWNWNALYTPAQQLNLQGVAKQQYPCKLSKRWKCCYKTRDFFYCFSHFSREKVIRRRLFFVQSSHLESWEVYSDKRSVRGCSMALWQMQVFLQGGQNMEQNKYIDLKQKLCV